eukprot:29739-Pelagococcus_subviridis.AAC.1
MFSRRGGRVETREVRLVAETRARRRVHERAQMRRRRRAAAAAAAAVRPAPPALNRRLARALRRARGGVVIKPRAPLPRRASRRLPAGEPPRHPRRERVRERFKLRGDVRVIRDVIRAHARRVPPRRRALERADVPREARDRGVRVVAHHIRAARVGVAVARGPPGRLAQRQRRRLPREELRDGGASRSVPRRRRARTLVLFSALLRGDVRHQERVVRARVVRQRAGDVASELRERRGSVPREHSCARRVVRRRRRSSRRRGLGNRRALLRRASLLVRARARRREPRQRVRRRRQRQRDEERRVDPGASTRGGRAIFGERLRGVLARDDDDESRVRAARRGAERVERRRQRRPGRRVALRGLVRDERARDGRAREDVAEPDRGEDLIERRRRRRIASVALAARAVCRRR